MLEGAAGRNTANLLVEWTLLRYCPPSRSIAFRFAISNERKVITVQGAPELIPGWQPLSLSISTSPATSFSLSSIALSHPFFYVFSFLCPPPPPHPVPSFLSATLTDKLDSIIANHDGRDDSHVADRPAPAARGKCLRLSIYFAMVYHCREKPDTTSPVRPRRNRFRGYCFLPR